MTKKPTSSKTRKAAPKPASAKKGKKKQATAPAASESTRSVLDGPMKSLIRDAFLKRNR